MHTVDTIMPETVKLRLNRLKKSISVPNHFSHTFLETVSRSNLCKRIQFRLM